MRCKLQLGGLRTEVNTTQAHNTLQRRRASKSACPNIFAIRNAMARCFPICPAAALCVVYEASPSGANWYLNSRMSARTIDNRFSCLEILSVAAQRTTCGQERAQNINVECRKEGAVIPQATKTHLQTQGISESKTGAYFLCSLVPPLCTA